MIATANPEIRKAVDILYEISADEKVRAEYNARQKAWMDRQSQFDGYYKKGKIETASNLKSLPTLSHTPKRSPLYQPS
ncbi:hypothetical protein R84B8_02704 [Treponema sp. R8-4-B8]